LNTPLYEQILGLSRKYWTNLKILTKRNTLAYFVSMKKKKSFNETDTKS